MSRTGLKKLGIKKAGHRAVIAMCWGRQPPSSALLLSPKSLSLPWEKDLSSGVGSRCSLGGIAMRRVSFKGLHYAVCAFAHPTGLLIAASAVSRSHPTERRLRLTVGVKAFRYSGMSSDTPGQLDQLCCSKRKVYIFLRCSAVTRNAQPVRGRALSPGSTSTHRTLRQSTHHAGKIDSHWPSYICI